MEGGKKQEEAGRRTLGSQLERGDINSMCEENYMGMGRV